MIEFWNNISFANPGAFWLFIGPGLILLWYLFKYKSIYPELWFSNLKSIKTSKLSAVRGLLKNALIVPRLLTLSLLVLALARPQSALNEENITTEGIDIVLATDISGSMLALDFKPNRLEASKEVGKEFIEGRKDDRIGLVVFAGESFTQCPITTDFKVVKKLLSEIKNGLIEDGTAIGMGLATAVNRLKESDSKSKVVILLTDGVNNSGFIDPLTAAEAAIQYGIRVYTVGVGTHGTAPYPFKAGNRTVYQDIEVKIDEDLLKEISELTGGKYFRATDKNSLEGIYREIDTLEKSKIEVASVQRLTEEFYPLVWLAGILLLMEIILRFAVLRSIP